MAKESDALFSRYRRLVLQPEKRRRKIRPAASAWRHFVYCLCFAAPFLMGSLYFINKADAPWWISALGVLIGLLAYRTWGVISRLSRSMQIWGPLFGLFFVELCRILAHWVLPKERNSWISMPDASWRYFAAHLFIFCSVFQAKITNLTLPA